MGEAATKTLEEEREDLRSWITSYNSEAKVNETVSATHDDKSPPLQVEVEMKHKNARNKNVQKTKTRIH